MLRSAQSASRAILTLALGLSGGDIAVGQTTSSMRSGVETALPSPGGSATKMDLSRLAIDWPQPPVSPLMHCPIDFDHSGFVDFEDFDMFVRAFEVASPTSDFNNDGFVTADDFSDFVSAFNAGCGALPEGPLFPGQLFKTGRSAFCVAIADLDGDGARDIAVVNNASNSVSVLRNLGNGQFADKIDMVTGDKPNFVAVGDIDGDGRPDLVVANNGIKFVSVYRNNSGLGDVQFAERIDYATADNPASVAIGDLDADGKVDLATANYGLAGLGNTVSVFRNTSGGGVMSLAPRSDHVVGTGPYAILISELTGDDQSDIAVCNFRSNSVGLLRNTTSGGTISLAAAVSFQTGARPISLAAGDLDGDARPDLVVANSASGSNGNSISVLRNQGGGTFAAKVDFAMGSNPYCVAVGDVSGDGRLDIVTANVSDGSVSVRLNVSLSGTLAFMDRREYVARSEPSGVAIGDMDGDGYPDLAVSNAYANKPSTGGVMLLRNSGNGIFQARATYAIQAIPAGTALGDLNGDRYVDAVVPHLDTGTVSMFRNLGDGRLEQGIDLIAGRQLSCVAIGDFDGDSRQDLAVANITTGEVSVYRSTSQHGEVSFASPVNFPVGPTPFEMAVGDLDGNGQPDIVVLNGTGATISVLLNLGDGLFATKVEYAAGSQPKSITINDFDGDGHPDIAVANYNAFSVSVLRNLGHGTFGDKVAFSAGESPSRVCAADFDRDGRTDLAVVNDRRNSVSLLRNTSASGMLAFNPRIVVSSPDAGTIISGDFDNDGRTDLGVVNTVDEAVCVLLNQTDHGDLVFERGAAFDVGELAQKVSSGDLNGDGWLDLVMAYRRPSGAYALTVLLNQQGEHSSGSLFQPVPAAGPVTPTR